MENKSQKYHLVLAEYFHSKDNFLESIEKQRARVKRYPPTYRPANIRKVVELPRQYLQSKQLEKIEALLINLFFMEAKAEAEMVSDLLVDLKLALAELPANSPKNRILRLIEVCIRRNLHFISYHPTALFQCLWNSCWWFDCPEASNHFTPAKVPMNDSELNLSYLMEYWRRQKEEATPGFFWIRALRPPKLSLGAPLEAIFLSDGIEFTSVGITYDGSRVAAGGRDGIIRVWEIDTGKLLPVCDYSKRMDRNYFSKGPRLEGKSANTLKNMFEQLNIATGGISEQINTSVKETMGLTIESIAFFPDGIRLVSGTRDATVRIWNTSTGEEIQCLRGHKNSAIKVSVSSSGKYVASIALGEDKVFLWDITKKDLNEQLKIYKKHIRSICFGPNDKFLAVGYIDGSLQIWNIDSRTEVCTLQGHNNQIDAIAFGRNGQIVITGSNNGYMNVWDIETQKLVYSVHAHDKSITSLVYCQARDIIVTGSRDRRVRLWNTQNATEIATWPSNGEVLGLATTVIGQKVASIAELGGVGIWTMKEDAVENQLKGHVKEITTIAITNDEKTIVTSGLDSTIYEWDTDNGVEYGPQFINESAVKVLILTPDNLKYICSLVSNKIVVWDKRDHRILTSISLQNKSCITFAISHDSQTLASGYEDGTVYIRHIETGTEIVSLHKTESSVFSLAFFPNDANQIVVGWQDGGLAIFDLLHKSWNELAPHHMTAGKSLEYLLAQDPLAFSGRAAIATIAVSPNGDRIVSGSYDRSIRFWDSRIGIETAHGDHDSTVLRIAFSPDGDRVASWSQDCEVKIWDIRSGRCIKSFYGITDLSVAVKDPVLCPIIAVQWAEETLLQSNYDGTVLGWYEHSVYDLRALKCGTVWTGVDRDTYLYIFKVEKN